MVFPGVLELVGSNPFMGIFFVICLSRALLIFKKHTTIKKIITLRLFLLLKQIFIESATSAPNTGGPGGHACTLAKHDLDKVYLSRNVPEPC